MILSLSEAVDLVLFIYCELGFYIFILIGLIVSSAGRYTGSYRIPVFIFLTI